jgi:hypothetical protein
MSRLKSRIVRVAAALATLAVLAWTGSAFSKW